ncbi:MAG TPA: pyridoxamine 5'-phosphate oxidase [Legionella sp.]|nr:pyridoxamine 5'-phosphate oxidase [Legionella sp.]
MSHWSTLADIRREYGRLSLSEEDAHTCPIAQFNRWFLDVLNAEKNDPTAMLLSTVDESGRPDSRVVLLKGLEDGAFIFYTNYDSAKSIQIQNNPHVALNFYWPSMVRQVRIRGKVERVSEGQSDAYFASRPKASQLSAVISPQSREVSGRHELEQALNALIATNQQETVMRPIHWGGYQVIPNEFEFWQGRDNRLHDRIHYYREQDRWLHHRLAP